MEGDVKNFKEVVRMVSRLVDAGHYSSNNIQERRDRVV